jgi:hypothetical protein
MEKILLEKLVEQNFTIEQISIKVGKSKTSVRHWLKKYGLKTLRSFDLEKLPPSGVKFCKKCSEEKGVEDFYRRRDGKDTSSYCKSCMINQAIDRQRAFKSKCIEYKGGSCQECGYNKCDSALEFHHLNPKEKDFTISHIKLTNFGDKVKKELDKCILVCANCHREIHSKFIKI